MIHSPPPCWSCQQFLHQRHGRSDGADYRWHCRLAQPGFPQIGKHCSSYVYEPGSDAEVVDEQAKSS
jgi:hypothetical protein